MIDRISIVSRLAQVLYADGVPADRVAYIPHQIALFDAIAQSYATGKAPSIPLALMAGDLCPFEPTDVSELDQPIPFTVVEPAPTPEPETSPAGAAAALPVEVVAKTAAPAPRKGARLRQARIDWDSETRLGKISDAVLGRELGVTSNAVRMARLARGIPFAPDFNRKYGPKRIDWDNETRLGKVPDPQLAAELGVNPSAVHQARQVRGIPSATPPRKPPAPPPVTPERQTELDAIEAAVKAGKVKRFTHEEALADLHAKYRAEPTRYGRGRPTAKKGQTEGAP